MSEIGQLLQHLRDKYPNVEVEIGPIDDNPTDREKRTEIGVTVRGFTLKDLQEFRYETLEEDR